MHIPPPLLFPLSHTSHSLPPRQTVQYIQPQHHAKLAQAELLVIDEAAAIPLPLVKAMLGPYLVFLCSTVNGYEVGMPQGGGTGGGTHHTT